MVWVSGSEPKEDLIMNKTIALLVNDYIGDDYRPSRELMFTITEDCLKDYLTDIEDDRTIDEFLDTYDSDESSVIYEYASDDNRILSESISYSNSVIESYNDFINGNQKGTDITTEDYYWTFYKAD